MTRSVLLMTCVRPANPHPSVSATLIIHTLVIFQQVVYRQHPSKNAINN